MERQDILELMETLKLYGMRAAFDEIVANSVKRQHAVQRILADLLKAEIDESEARAPSVQARSERAFDQIPDDHRQAAARQGPRAV